MKKFLLLSFVFCFIAIPAQAVGVKTIANPPEYASTLIRTSLSAITRTLLSDKSCIEHSRNHDTKKVNGLIQKKSNPSELEQVLNKARGKRKNTLLHRSVARGDLDLSELLLKNGADPLIKNADEISPLDLALGLNDWLDLKESQQGAFDRGIVRHWLKQSRIDGAASAFEKKLNSFYPGKENTFLHRSILRGDLELTETLISHHADLFMKDGIGGTPFDLLRRRYRGVSLPSGLQTKIDRIVVNRWIKDSSINPEVSLSQLLNEGDLVTGETLLHRSILRGDYAFTDLLISQGADPLQTNERGISPLGQALITDAWGRFPTSTKNKIHEVIAGKASTKIEFLSPLSGLTLNEIFSIIKQWIKNDSLLYSTEKWTWMSSLPAHLIRQNISDYASQNASDQVLYLLAKWSFVEDRYYQQEKRKSAGTLEPFVRERLPQLSSDLRTALEGKSSRDQMIHLARLIDLMIRNVSSYEDCKLIRTFMKRVPLFKEDPASLVQEREARLKQIEELTLFPEILKSFLHQNTDDEALTAAYLYVSEFTSAFINSKLTKNAKTTAKIDANHDCGICYEKIEDDHLALPCGHHFHSHCFALGMKSLLEQENLETLKRCYHQDCNHKLTPEELASVITDPKQVISIQRLFVRSLGSFLFCPKCGDGVARQNKILGFCFECQSCKTELCFACGREPHHGISCEELYSEVGVKNVFLKQVLENGEADWFGLCPGCKVIIEKLDGCDAMTCGNNASDKPALQADQFGSISGRGCGMKFDWNARIQIKEVLKHPDQYSIKDNPQPVQNIGFFEVDNDFEYYVEPQEDSFESGGNVRYNESSSESSESAYDSDSS